MAVNLRRAGSLQWGAGVAGCGGRRERLQRSCTYKYAHRLLSQQGQQEFQSVWCIEPTCKVTIVPTASTQASYLAMEGQPGIVNSMR
jgi:hypothetical protein